MLQALAVGIATGITENSLCIARLTDAAHNCHATLAGNPHFLGQELYIYVFSPANRFREKLHAYPFCDPQPGPKHSRCMWPYLESGASSK